MLSFSALMEITFANRMREGISREMAVRIPNKMTKLIRASFIKRTFNDLFPSKNFRSDYIYKNTPDQHDKDFGPARN